jgi:hypothetical protein
MVSLSWLWSTYFPWKKTVRKSVIVNFNITNTHTLSNKPERELISANDARCAVVSSLVGNKLAGKNVEDRAPVADEFRVAGSGLGGISGGGKAKSNSGWVGAAEVAGENGRRSLSQDRLDACSIEEVLHGVDGTRVRYIVLAGEAGGMRPE